MYKCATAILVRDQWHTYAIIIDFILFKYTSLIGDVTKIFVIFDMLFGNALN